MRTRLAIALVAIATLLVLCAPTSQSSAQETLTSRLVQELSANYDVASGYPKLYTKADCPSSYAVLRNCLGNNPAAPYILPIVPTWPNEFSDPAMQNAFGETRPGDSATYRLDPREAIVVFGTLPPAGRYMGLQSYVATHQGSFDQSSPVYQYLQANIPSSLGIFFDTVPRNPRRVQSFSDLGNSINNVIIDQQSGASFGTLRFFITTPDAGMDLAVRSALGQLGIPSADIFTEPISSSDARLGLDASADDFVTTMRYALPNDPEAGNEWRQTLPLSVLRVRERPSSTRPAQPYPAAVYDARSAAPETQYGGDLKDLVGAICKRWGSCSGQMALPDLEVPPFNMVGPDCRPIGMNCLAPTQDTPYYFSNDLTLDHGEIYAVADTLATETGNATYVSLGINETSKLLGVANVDDPALQGSAASFAPAVHNTDELFVYYLTRSCAGLENLTGQNCLSITNDMVPLGGSFKISLRDYVRPPTARGPDSAQLLKPIVMRVVPVTTPTSVALTSSQNPSQLGQPVNFTASVVCSGFSPTGSVTFNDGSTALGVASLRTGSASFASNGLTTGSHSITAAYSGDTNCAGGSAVLTQIVGGTASSIVVSSAQNPSALGQPISLVAMVRCGAFTPTGSVTFTDGGVPLGMVPLRGLTATFTTSSLASGSHSITASYSGDANCGAVTSAVLTQVVGSPGTATGPPAPGPAGCDVAAQTRVSGLACPPSGSSPGIAPSSPPSR